MRASATLLAALLGFAGLAGAHAATVPGHDRITTVTLRPAVGEISLAVVSFPRAGSSSVSAAELDVKAAPPAGDDFLAFGRVSGAPHRALVLVADRATGLLDPASLRVTLRSRHALGPPSLRSANDVLEGTGDGTPSLCELATGGRALAGSQVTALGSQGEALSGIGSAEALAQAYDDACGLPHTETLREAVKDSPPGEVPGCGTCPPEPGRACPLSARTAVCVAADAGAGQTARHPAR